MKDPEDEMTAEAEPSFEPLEPPDFNEQPWGEQQSQIDWLERPTEGEEDVAYSDSDEWIDPGTDD